MKGNIDKLRCGIPNSYFYIVAGSVVQECYSTYDDIASSVSDTATKEEMLAVSCN